MLDAWNIRTNRANKLLDHKNLEPFKIIKVINNLAHKLKLLPSISSIFPVFYPWLFYLDKSNLLSRQITLLPSSIWFNKDIGLEKYVAEEILNLRIDKRMKNPVSGKRRYLMYKIKFMGRDEWNANPDWQVWTDTAGCQDIVADFHHKNKEKPGLHPSFQMPEDKEPVLNLLSCKNINSSELHV